MLCFQTVNGPALLGRTSIVIWIIRKYNFSILIRFWVILGHILPWQFCYNCRRSFWGHYRPNGGAWRQINGLWDNVMLHFHSIQNLENWLFVGFFENFEVSCLESKIRWPVSVSSWFFGVSLVWWRHQDVIITLSPGPCLSNGHE